jgi:NTE family protein
MKLTLILLLLASLGCQNLRSQRSIEESGSPAVESPQETSAEPTAAEVEPVKLGVILGPGGARALAHIGFLKQLQTKKIPVVGIVGVEWGALVAASFANKASSHEVEWQLSKIRDWNGKDQSDIRAPLKLIQTYLQSARAEASRVPFACPSLNLKKSQVYMMAKGRLDQLLPFCLAYPPLFDSHSSTISANRELARSAEYLRSQGANYIIFVNVLSGLSLAESSHWLELAYDMKKKWPGIDERLDLVIDKKSIRDFKLQTEMIQLGFEQSQSFVEKLQQKM